MSKAEWRDILPVTAALIPDDFCCSEIDNLPEAIGACFKLLERFPYLRELAEVEIERYRLWHDPPSLPLQVDSWQVRPGIALLEVAWSGLVEVLTTDAAAEPERGKSLILIIPETEGVRPHLVTPDSQSLLALKLVAEQHDLRSFAAEHKVPVAFLQDTLRLGEARGILLKPPSRIVRPDGFCTGPTPHEQFLSGQVFTLQWHITQSCDLHCRHCYDRSRRQQVSLENGRTILDSLYDFCVDHRVSGQVSFTGGNPLLHPDFFELYESAVEKGFMTAILGNPTDRDSLLKINDIQKPEFFQVSLEGLREHNDYMRGRNHFDRTLRFLALLKEMDIYSMVMLTLTRANRHQVLELAELLRDRVDLFTFNRLSMVGEGATLLSVEQADYRGFLESYREAARNNPIMRRKDNLFNILQVEDRLAPEGGCAGHGCGAAFNFVSLLPDGQVHACRKFPSILGNICEQGLDTIYHSEPAESYRMGNSACRGCEIRPVCGGCPAVIHGFGMDSLTELDPYCFMVRT
jgi:selenobiotic family peptide radical SAM maturase